MTKVGRRRLVGAGLGLLVVALVGAFRWTIRATEPDVDPRRFDGTQAMAERLKEFAAQQVTERILQIVQPTSGLAQYYSAFHAIKDPPDERSRVLIEAKKADVLLVDGNTLEAIERYKSARTLAEQHPELFDKAFFHALGD